MRKTIMLDYTNVVQVKQFREKFGFTQEEFAALLDITRPQLSMAESLSRPLPPEAEQTFIGLKLRMTVSNDTAGSDTDWKAFEQEQQTEHAWLCSQQLIRMEYQLTMLRKELEELKRAEQQYRQVVDSWNSIPTSVKEQGWGTSNVTTIYNRAFARLKKCAAASQLEKQLQIKIILAGIDVLKQFIRDNHLA